MTNPEYVILVDEQDNPIGVQEKIKAHELAQLHRAFSVFIFRKVQNIIELLLQCRHKDKYHCPNLWTNTCCSHPRVGETVLAGATRRLKEEMGIETVLHPVGTFHYKAVFDNGLTEHEFDHVLIGGVKPQLPIEINPLEVQEYAWIPIDELRERFKNEPHLYTPWFIKAFEIAWEKKDLIENILLKLSGEH
ncbi:MAG: isopentenyl-diphosphate delta-isomerase [Francisellaceae bacterium]|nr:isopentenyl-diphosphate delta-isomerase [Francisellaceae bacterium]